MAVMMIESTDPNFSINLRKNPASGMTIKKMRSGVLSGWYPNDDTQKYAMWFKETSTENSFSTEDGKNYLDLTQYASTYFVFNALSTFFNHALKLDETQAYSGVVHKITIPNVQLRTEKTFRHLCEFIEPGYWYITKKTEGDSERMALYEITIHSDGTLNEFLMRNYLLFYLLHADLHASDIVWMEGMITKVVSIMKELKCPYFLWYWFKKNVLVKHNFFAELEDELGKNSKDGTIVMQYGDTQTQRKNFVSRNIGAFDLDILDVGCGGGDYVLPYAKKLKENGKRVVGVDIDENIVSKLNDKFTDRKLSNAIAVTNLNDAEIDDLHDIICIEVIEHMPVDEAKELISKLMQRNFRKLIISTPNITFNQFYTTMNGFRHDDHHFEFTQDEFRMFILETSRMSGVKNLIHEYFDVGDKVNIIPMALGCIVTKSNYENRICVGD